MNWKKHASTLILVLLALPLAVYAYLDRKSVSDGERKDRSTDVFPAYRRQDVNRVEVSAGGVTMVVERRSLGDAGDTEWWMTSPEDERADAAAVDKLLGDIEFAGIVRKVDPQVASFEAPRVTGLLAMGPLVYHFALGGDAPTPAGTAYFRVDGEGVFVVSKDFVASLLRGPDAYRERTIVPYLSLELQRLAVKGQGASFTLERIDEVSFRLPDLGLRASRETLDRVWSALAEARAESFLTGEEAERALGPDPVILEMKPRDPLKRDGELLFGGPCPGHPEDIVAVRRAPTRRAACVPKGLLPGLLVTSRELVESRLFAARGDEVAELLLESVPAGTRVEIARKGSGWHERAPNDRELVAEEADAANLLASTLAKSEGSDPMAGDPKAPFGAVARVRVERGDGKGEEVVELGKASAGGAGYLVRRDADGATLRVSETLAHKLVPSEIVFRGRQLFSRAIEGKLATTLETECDGTAQAVSRVEGGWSFTKPAGYAGDSAVITSLISSIEHAQAESWVANDDDGSFGFKGSPCSSIVTYEEAGAPHRFGIVFGREAEGGEYFAHALGEGPVFLASRAMHEDASLILVDRTGFHTQSTEVETLVLAHAGATLTVKGRDKKLALPDGGGADLGEKLALSLDTMRADYVVHLGPALPKEGLGRPALDVRIKTRSEAGAKDVHFLVGDSALVLKERMFYARLEGVDATFAISRDKLEPLLNAL